MKKSVLIVLLLLLCVGCSTKYQPTRIALFSCAEKDCGLLVLLDDNNKTIKEVNTVYPVKYYVQDNVIYVSYDGKNYDIYSCTTGKMIGGLNGANGDLLFVNDDKGYVSSDSGYIYYFDKNNNPLTQMECEVNYCLGFHNQFCLVDDNNHLYIFDQGNIASIININNFNHLALALIEEKFYLVSENSYSLIEDGEINVTYLIREDIEIKRTNKDLLYAYSDDELACYKVSFSQYFLELELLLDDKYYQEIEYQQAFKDYYEKGYEIETIFLY